jgi:hypothetical protein
MKKLNVLLNWGLALGFILAMTATKAQLHVNSSGNVGIGTSSPIARLHLDNTSHYRAIYVNNTYAGSTNKYGIYNTVTSTGTGSHYGIDNSTYTHTSSTYHFGLRNINYVNSTDNGFGINNYTYCQDGEGDRWGIYNYMACLAGCGGGEQIAFYSQMSGSCDGGYAGYFSGDVHVAGTLTSLSDAGKKTNINAFVGALNLISQLKPKTYNYVNDPDFSLPREKQFGFLAQDLEAVLPDLVKTVPAVGQTEPDENGDIQPVITGELKAVNYLGLIPILVQGMQEQQKTIEDQQKRISELEAKIDR